MLWLTLLQQDDMIAGPSMTRVLHELPWQFSGVMRAFVLYSMLARVGEDRRALAGGLLAGCVTWAFAPAHSDARLLALALIVPTVAAFAVWRAARRGEQLVGGAAGVVGGIAGGVLLTHFHPSGMIVALVSLLLAGPFIVVEAGEVRLLVQLRRKHGPAHHQRFDALFELRMTLGMALVVGIPAAWVLEPRQAIGLAFVVLALRELWRTAVESAGPSAGLFATLWACGALCGFGITDAVPSFYAALALIAAVAAVAAVWTVGRVSAWPESW
jgi:hypothetical protein